MLKSLHCHSSPQNYTQRQEVITFVSARSRVQVPVWSTPIASDFFRFHQSNLMADVLRSKPRPCPTTSFPIHHSLVILSLDATIFTCSSFRKSSQIHAYPLYETYGTCHVSTFKFTIALKIHTDVCGVTPCSLVFRPMFQEKCGFFF